MCPQLTLGAVPGDLGDEARHRLQGTRAGLLLPQVCLTWAEKGPRPPPSSAPGSGSAPHYLHYNNSSPQVENTKELALCICQHVSCS